MKKSLFAFAALLLLPILAHAQTFSVVPLNGISPLTTTITWNVPSATSCTATGTGWSGTKAGSGSEQVALTASSTIGLSCSVSTPAGPGTATLSWSAPTENVPECPVGFTCPPTPKVSTPYSNPGGYWVYRGTSASTLAKAAQITNPATTVYVENNLAPGSTTYFGVSAYSAAGAESDVSAPGSKTISGEPVVTTFTDSKAVAVSPPPRPVAPVLTVQ